MCIDCDKQLAQECTRSKCRKYLYQTSRRGTKLINKSARSLQSNKMKNIHIHLTGGQLRQHSVAAFLVFATICLATNSINQALAIGQDFEDLSKETFGNLARPTSFASSNNQQNVFHSRQPQSQQLSPTSTSASRQFRPNRFVQTTSNNNNNQQQQASAQESSPPAFLASAGSQSQQQPQPQRQPTAQAPSNIEQMMKNALSRTSQFSGAPEPRQDTAARADEPQLPASSPVQQQSSTRSIASSQSSFTPVPSTSMPAVNSNDKVAESTGPSAAGTEADEEERQTTASQTSSTSGHETVYSDQRFANLFARRGANKKQRIQPHEQAKAKPTLPSFIKSPPDPKQFAAQPQPGGPERLGSNQQSGSSFTSQRIQQQQQQQQNQARLNALNQQKKPAITSTSAAIANNKRASSLANNKQVSVGLSSAKSTTPSPKAASSTIKPLTQSFNKVNNDPASVIAMARKRLLANNALESGKLKQQQQNKPAI